MHQTHISSYLDEIVHPTCVKCGAPMWLARIEPDGPVSQKRTFECQVCLNEVVEIVRHSGAGYLGAPSTLKLN